MASVILRMKAQMAGLATSSAVGPYEMFTDIVDGIDDVEIEEIANQLEELEFTQADVNKSLYRFVAHIKKAYNYRVIHITLPYPGGMDDYANLQFKQGIGGEPPQLKKMDLIDTLMTGHIGITRKLFLGSDIFLIAILIHLKLDFLVGILIIQFL